MQRWRALLANRAFTLLWAGRTISWFGNAMAPIALGFAVLDITGSVADLSAVVAARSVPNLLLVLFGGVLADRAMRNQALVAASLVSAASQGLCVALIATGAASIPALMAISVVNGAAAALSGPASGALFRLVVRDDQLRDANVLGRIGMNGALLSGAALGGVIVGVLGPGAALAIDSLTFLLAGIAFLWLPRIEVTESSRGSLLGALRDGFRYVIDSRWISGIIIVTFVHMACFAGGLQVIALVVADASFGRAGMGLAASAQIGGSLLGAVAVAVIRDRVPLNLTLLAMGGALCLPLLVLGAGAAGVIPSKPPAIELLVATIIAMTVAGIAFQMASIIQDLAFQRNVPAEKIGRVGSYATVASIGGIPAGEIAAAPLTGAFGVGGALLALACLMMVTVLTVATHPSVRHISSAPAKSQ